MAQWYRIVIYERQLNLAAIFFICKTDYTDKYGLVSYRPVPWNFKTVFKSRIYRVLGNVQNLGAEHTLNYNSSFHYDLSISYVNVYSLQCSCNMNIPEL